MPFILFINIMFIKHTKQMQYVKEFDILDANSLKELSEQILSDKREFNDSLLYHPDSQAKILDPNIRTSEFRLFTEDALFDLAEKYIGLINIADPDYDYILQRNDLTHIRYSTGGFFKPHSDYLSYTSNLVDEYTMIICLRADCQGGETILHLNKFFKHVSKATTTPFHSLLFRKDITHEGAVLTSGMKEILTLNILAISKKADHTVVISFSDSKKIHLISFNQLKQFPGNLILAKLSFTGRVNHDNELISKDKLIHYLITDTDAEDFEIIARILKGQIVNITELEDNHELIDYYLLDVRNLISNSIISKHTPGTTSPTELKTNFENDVVVFGDEDEFNLHLAKVKSEKLPLMPFVMIWMEGIVNADLISMTPGLLMFSEYQNIMYLRKFCSSISKVPENTVDDYTDDFRHWLNLHHPVSDSNEDLQLHQFIHHYHLDENDHYYFDVNEDNEDVEDNDNNTVSRPNASNIDNYLCEDEDFIQNINDDDDDNNSFLMEGYAIPKVFPKTKFHISLEEHGESNFHDHLPVAYFDCSTQTDYYHELDKGFNISLYLELKSTLPHMMRDLLVQHGHDNKIGSTFRLFHPTIPNSQYSGQHYNLDKNGRLCLEKRHLAPLMEKVSKTNLVEKVEKLLPKVVINSKQRHSYDAFMCNEQVYGSTTVVAIWGFLKM